MSTSDSRCTKLELKTKTCVTAKCMFCFVFLQYYHDTYKNMETLLKFAADKKTSTLDEDQDFRRV